MGQAFWMIMAFISGIFLPVQAGLNARLGKTISSPIYASLISFLIGALAVGIYLVATKQQMNWPGFKNVPAYLWLGGVGGAFYVTVIILAFPEIGPALTFGLVVAGQMFAAVFLDHFEILVVHQQSINIWRVFGVMLIVGGVVIIRKF